MKPLVLFGASGALLDHIMRGLTRFGTKPVALTDNNRRLWWQQVDGVTIYPPHEALRLFGESAEFVLCMSDASYVRSQLWWMNGKEPKSLSFAQLCFRFPDALLPYFALDVLPNGWQVEAQKASDIWADDASRAEYVAQMDWRESHDDLHMPAVSGCHEDYFPPDLITLTPEHTIVDCGAYTGDTLREVLARFGAAFKRYIAIEPDNQNIVQLDACVAALEPDVRQRIESTFGAVGAEYGRIAFNATHDTMAHVGSGQYAINVWPIDDFSVPSPSFVKMDIEGSEQDALRGAVKLLEAGKTAWAICLYHKPDDLWKIPLFVKEHMPDARLYLRRYADGAFETIMYVLPGVA